MRYSYIFTLFMLIISGDIFSQIDYSALSYWNYYSDAENSLYKLQCDLSFDYLNNRKQKIDQLKTKADWEKRQKEVKDILERIAGPFPEKTPLNPVTTGKVKGDGFTVEKLYFESMPGYKVTAALFLPDGKKKHLPTIIYCSGHSDLAFRSDTYQHVIINLVKKGFAVFAFDPIGQGERQQYFESSKGKSRFGPTREHSYPGAQLFINGASAARYMIWDGIRSVDYLLTRKEIDPERIGITGRSGGGTQSSYIAAYDERIRAAAPECYITSLAYLLKSHGPQDAEQNFIHGISEGFDLADLLEVRAPKPALMITTTRDIFSIQGAKETFAEAKGAYKALGMLENLEMVESNAGHASTLKNRETMYAFFQKHLGNPGSNEDVAIDTFQVEDLYITETGQVSTSIGSKFLFDVNLELAKANRDKLKVQRNKTDYVTEVKEATKSLTGYEKVQSYGKLVFGGRTEYQDHYLDKYLIECENEMVLPFIVFSPKGESAKAALYLDDIKDKKSTPAHEVPLHLVQQGVRVIVPDLPGYGELGPGYLKGDAYFNNTSYNQWFAGILNDKSMVAIHAEAIKKVLFHNRELLGNESMKFSCISKGPFNSSMLHTAVLGNQFNELVMINPLISFESLVSNHNYEPSFVPFSVAGQLAHYDLSDLASVLAPMKIQVINPVDHLGKPLEEAEVSKAYEATKKHYKSMNSAENFTIFIGEDFLGEVLN